MNTKNPNANAAKKSKLWLFFVAAFALQLAAWAAWFIIASHHPVQEVPVVRIHHP